MALFDRFFKRKPQSSNPEVSKEIRQILGPEAETFSVNNKTVFNNQNFETFRDFSSIDKIVTNRSVINKELANSEYYGLDATEGYVNFSPIEAMPLITNKGARIKQYRRISALPECDWCLGQIADDFIHEDESGKFVNLNLPIESDNLNENRRNVLQKEFEKFVNLFNFKDEGFNLMKRFLVEGELTWENIIDSKHPERGILGLRFIPCEYYETLVDTSTGEKVGLFIDVKQYKQDIRMLLSQSFYNSRQIFNDLFGVNDFMNNEDAVPMLWPQITYISSGDVSPDGLFCFPLIEKAKQAYYQYILMKESAVILRVTRAPERLLFNVNTGNLPQKVAMEYVRRFANSMRQKKVMDGKTLDKQTSGNPNSVMGENPNGILNTYNPVSMLETYIFGKSNANDGTTIDTVNSTAQYDQIEDLKYFQKALFKQFGVPWSRWEAPDQMNEQNDSLSYEEYTFSRSIIRLQRRFAIGLKESFITHLKLRGIFDQYDLHESDIDINFTRPVLYDITQVQKLMESKIAAYAQLADREEFSKTIAMKKILGMTDEQIEENFRQLAKEKVWAKAAEYYEGMMKSGESSLTPKQISDLIDRDANPLGPEEDSSGEGGGGEEGGPEEEAGEEESPAEPPMEEPGEEPGQETEEEELGP